MSYKNLREDYITVNKYARSGWKLVGVRKIVMHWTANAGATASNHKRYFQNIKNYASAHIFIDRIESICIIPLNEVAFHANERTNKVKELEASTLVYPSGDANLSTIGIEMCVEKDGTIHRETIQKSEDVAVELCKKYGLNPKTDIVRHYDVTGKNCPAPWVADPKQFTAFKNNVDARVNPKPTKKPVSKPVSTASKEKAIGSVLIEVASLNIRKSADFDAKIVGTAVKKSKFPVYEKKDGLFRIGKDKWISAHPDYSKYTAIVAHTYHIVKSGETVSELAEKYKTTITKIKEWNKLDKNYSIDANQKLRVK